MRSTNPRDYWKILNASNTNNKCAVDINDMFHFLKSVNKFRNYFDNEVKVKIMIVQQMTLVKGPNATPFKTRSGDLLS